MNYDFSVLTRKLRQFSVNSIVAKCLELLNQMDPLALQVKQNAEKQGKSFEELVIEACHRKQQTDKEPEDNDDTRTEYRPELDPAALELVASVSMQYNMPIFDEKGRTKEPVNVYPMKLAANRYRFSVLTEKLNRMIVNFSYKDWKNKLLKLSPNEQAK